MPHNDTDSIAIALRGRPGSSGQGMLTRREKALKEALWQIVQRHGKFAQGEVTYEQNARDDQCQDCLFFEEEGDQGQPECQIVEDPIEPDGTCVQFLPQGEGNPEEDENPVPDQENNPGPRRPSPADRAVASRPAGGLY